MPDGPRDVVRRYGLAAAAVVAAWLVRAALADTLLDRYPFTAFYIPVIVAAWLGGAGPALLAVALGAVAGGWETFPPDRPPWAALASNPIRVAVFVAYGSLIAALGGLYHAARGRAADQLAAARRHAAERERAERRYRRLIEGSPLSVEVVGADGRIREVNPAWEQLWGLTLDQAEGYSLLADRQLDEKGVMPAIRRAFAGETVVIPAFDYVPRAGKFKGRALWVRTVAYPVRGEGGAVEEVVLIQEDVSERRRDEGRLRLLAEAGRLLGASLDYETTLADVCRLVVPVLADWCTIDLWDGGGAPGEAGSIRRLAIVHADPAKVRLAEEFRRRYPPRPEDAGGLMKVLRTGEPELYPEITDEMIELGGKDDDHRRIIRALGLASGLVVPLTARGRILGALTLATAESGRHFGPADLPLAEELARRAALAVDNARLFAEARQAADRHRAAEEQLALLAEASASLSSNLDPPAVLAAVLALARRLVAADAYAVWRKRAETGLWAIELADGLSAAFQRTVVERLEPGRPAPAEPIVADDAGQTPALANRRDAYAAEGVRSLLAVPLRIHGEGCGTLVFYFRTPHPFSPVEVRVGTALGNLAASAIGSAELYEAQARMRSDAEAARHRLAFLADASSALVSTLDEEVTLQTIAALAVPDLADWCVVDLLRPDGTTRRITGRHSDPARDQWLPELLTLDPAAAAEVLRNGRLKVVNEVAGGPLDPAAADGDRARVLRQLGLGSYLVVPLTARGRTLGAISFASVRPHRYGPAEVDLATDLARRAALAVDHARLYREAREADRRKDEFLAMLAHELRNPLAPLRNALHILTLPDLPPGQAEQVRGLMARQVEHLVRMVDDLLDVSRLLRGKIELRTSTVDLADAVRRAVETAQPVIDARGHDLAMDLPDEPLPVRGDLVRLAQVFANLLNNAAKYTDRAGRITVSAAQEDGRAVVRVRDTGVGIDAEVLPKVFDLFVQADRSAARTQGGLGIGLTLVKRLVELHGGTVEARSEGPGKGSEFVVRLPAAASGGCEPPGSSANHRGADAPRSPERLRVLVVDDNVDAAESLAVLLRAAGHTVRTAHSGPAALGAAAALRPAAVVLDIGLPGMDGYAVAQALRRGPAADAVLIALTGYGQEEDRRRSKAAGFDHHLTKPADPGELADLLAGVAAAGRA